MKELFTINKGILIVPNEDEGLFRMYDYNNHNGWYVDSDGNTVPIPQNDASTPHDWNAPDDPTCHVIINENYYIYTTHALDWYDPVEGAYGRFGIKDMSGNVVTEEHYWQIGHYSNGLFAVREINGMWGCINEKGEQMLPFRYEDEPIFNKYGLAYGNGFLIDMNGTEIAGTEFNCIESPSEDDRYFDITLMTAEQDALVEETGSAPDITVDIFDTKNREFVVQGIPECRLFHSGYEGEPEVIQAAAGMLDCYDEVLVEGRGILVARNGKTQTVFDFYR